MTHSTLLRTILGCIALVLLAVPAQAQTPEELPDLSPAIARNLISQMQEVNEGEIDIAYVIAGEKAMKRGFTSRSAAVVVYLATRLEDGHRRRRCEEQIFLWTPQFGWFLEEVVEEPYRDYLRIFSEKKGFVELK